MVMKSLSVSLLVLLFVATSLPVRGDFTFYGVAFPSRGPRTSGVVRTSVPNFPWLSAGHVRTQEDLDRLLGKGKPAARESRSSIKPAIVYVSRQSTKTEKSNLAEREYFYFLQEEVKQRMGEYRWYWSHARSTLGRFLLQNFRKSGTALIIFERDGSVLHVESPIASPQSVARAMRMIKYKRRMEQALKADFPQLESELEGGNVKVVMKYLRYAAQHSQYASQRTAELLSSLRTRLGQQGERRIAKAEELVRAGHRKGALALLGEVKRDFQGHAVARRADEAARRIRGTRS